MSAASGSGRWWLRALVAGLVYAVFAQLALLMAIPPGYATAVWPAAGFALALVLAGGPRVAIGVALGGFAVNLRTELTSGVEHSLISSLVVAAVIGCGSALQALLGARLIRRWARSSFLFEEEGEVLRFAALGGPLACLCGALVGVTTLYVAGRIPLADVGFSLWTWWTGDTIGVLIFAPLTALWMAPSGAVSAQRLRQVTTPLLLGFIGVTWIFTRVSAWEEARLQQDFEKRARPVAQAVATAIAGDEVLVSFVVSLFDASEVVTPVEFHAYAARVLTRTSGVVGLSWNPVVTDAERPRFEAEVRARGLSPAGIMELGPGGLRPAARRSHYVTVGYVEPENELNAAAVGFDLASDPARRTALEAAAQTGRTRVTTRVQLLQGEPGVLLVAPVLVRTASPSQPWVPRAVEEVRGFVVVGLSVGRVMASALAGLDLAGLEVRLTDEAAPVEQRLLYARQDAVVEETPPGWTHTMMVGGRAWTLQVQRATPPRSWQAWLVLACGLAGVSLLGMLMLSSTGRASQTQRLLEAQTREATRAVLAEEKFRLAIEASPTGMIMVDDAGTIVLVNAQIEGLFGYARDELLGRPVETLVPERFRTGGSGAATALFQDPTARPMGPGRDLTGLRKDGTEVPIEIGRNPLRTLEGDFVLSSVADITERTKAERERERLMAELTALNGALEDRVQERTRALTALVQEREVLLQEVHHRVRNNLQVITSLIRLQVRKLDTGADRDALLECGQRVQAIALVHETLYQAKDYAQVRFAEYARGLVTNVFRTMAPPDRTVALELAIEDVSLAVDRAIPCGLVLNELVSNALKHAFRIGEAGTLRVELARRADGLLRLVVRDDGVGLPAGLDVEQGGSIGLQLLRALARQLDARLTVHGQEGTSFELVFSPDAKA